MGYLKINIGQIWLWVIVCPTPDLANPLTPWVPTLVLPYIEIKSE